MTHLTVKNEIFKKIQESSISYSTRLSQPKYHIPRWKNVTGSLKQKQYWCCIRKKSKNAYNKRKNEKTRFLGQKMWPVAHGQTHRQTHTRVTTVGTLSGFKEFFLQPIIKDRLNKKLVFLFVGRTLHFVALNFIPHLVPKFSKVLKISLKGKVHGLGGM